MKDSTRKNAEAHFELVTAHPIARPPQGVLTPVGYSRQHTLRHVPELGVAHRPQNVLHVHIETGAGDVGVLSHLMVKAGCVLHTHDKWTTNVDLIFQYVITCRAAQSCRCSHEFLIQV
jgi:hypothetical protein